jgi:nicotinamide riboside kinase
MEKAFLWKEPDSMPQNYKNKALQKGTRCSAGSALVINLFGGPGIGKTTLAARLFVALKLKNIEAACPEEYAKIALWQGRDSLLDHQLILIGQTWDTVSTLSNKVDVIILDSPILLSSHYAAGSEPDYFHKTVLDFHQRHDRFNILLTRNKNIKYSTSGRRETSQKAIDSDVKIKELLQKSGEDYLCMNPTEGILDGIVNQIASYARDKNLLNSSTSLLNEQTSN